MYTSDHQVDFVRRVVSVVRAHGYEKRLVDGASRCTAVDLRAHRARNDQVPNYNVETTVSDFPRRTYYTNYLCMYKGILFNRSPPLARQKIYNPRWSIQQYRDDTNRSSRIAATILTTVCQSYFFIYVFKGRLRTGPFAQVYYSQYTHKTIYYLYYSF